MLEAHVSPQGVLGSANIAFLIVYHPKFSTPAFEPSTVDFSTAIDE
jgi:hypothetical protein